MTSISSSNISPAPECEVWRDIPGWEGLYQVSNLGRVRSIRVRLTKPYDSRGYKVATLHSGELFASITEAADATGAQICKIVSCCQGERKHTKGLAWAYLQEVEV